jgi:hypothetical protein
MVVTCPAGVRKPTRISWVVCQIDIRRCTFENAEKMVWSKGKIESTHGYAKQKGLHIELEEFSVDDQSSTGDYRR